MSIIATVDPRTKNIQKLKRSGEIYKVKLPDGPVGGFEERQFLRLEWEDAALEARLVAMRAAGEPHPVILNPYAEYSEILDGAGQKIMKCRSRYIFEFSKDMTEEQCGWNKTTRAKILNRTDAKPILKKMSSSVTGRDWKSSDCKDDPNPVEVG